MDSGDFFLENVISNEVVTGELFAYINRADLLNCSLVSKQWVRPCRRALRKYHPCLLKVKTLRKNQLETVLELLENSVDIPYNGIVFCLSKIWRKGGFIATPREVDSIYKPLLEKIVEHIQPGVKTVSMRFGWYRRFAWENVSYFRLYCNLIPNASIEKLRITGEFDITFGSYFEDAESEFSQLKVLKLDIDKKKTGFEEYVHRFPALVEWSGVVRSRELHYFIRAKRGYLVKRLHIPYEIDPETVNDIEKASLRLRVVRVDLDATTVNVQIFRRIITSSSSNLEEVDMRFSFFRKYIQSGVPPLSSVKKLVVLKYAFGSESDLESDDAENYDSTIGISNTELRDGAQRLFPNATITFELDYELEYYSSDSDSVSESDEGTSDFELSSDEENDQA